MPKGSKVRGPVEPGVLSPSAFSTAQLERLRGGTDVRVVAPIPKIALSIEEAVAASGLGKDVINAAIRRGDLLHKRVGVKPTGGRRVVILVSSLEAWLAPDAPKIAETGAHG